MKNDFPVVYESGNFKTRFKENRKDFMHAEGKSKFAEHLMQKGYEMKNIENIMTITHMKINYAKINMLELHIWRTLI